MINLTEFDQIKLIAAGYGLLSGILTMAVEDVLRWLIKNHKLNLVKLIYKSVLFGLLMAVAFGVVSAVEITSAEVPLDSINQSMFSLSFILLVSNTISFLCGEFDWFRKSSSNQSPE